MLLNRKVLKLHGAAEILSENTLMNNLLEIDKLNVRFDLDDYTVQAVRDVSFTIEKGKALGLVGESGCGKSVTAYSIMKLISPPGYIASGDIMFDGKSLMPLDEESMRKIRGNRISMIFQEPMTSLNPVFTIGYQVEEVLLLHRGMDKKEAREYAEDMLHQVGIPSPRRRLNSYPHELSGGLRQRVMIAMALATNPAMLIADEPTTALDVTIQAQILDLLLSLQSSLDMSLLLISHDLGIVANTADHIAIMYAGEIVEYAPVDLLFATQLHPYTLGLFNAIPKMSMSAEKLYTIPGTVPTITGNPQGCVFHPRCPLGDEECTRKPVSLEEKQTGHYARCIKV